jgi:hypothetical protein
MSAADMLSLPDELLAALCRAVGVRAMQPRLCGSSRLHRAWQASVARLAIAEGPLAASDLPLLAKLTGLRSLTLRGLDHRQLPAWHALAALGPSLTSLTTLSIVGCYDTFGSLRALPSGGLSTRLQELQLEDLDCKLRGEDLLALAACSALRKLSLT